MLGDYIIHIFNNEMHMGRNVRGRRTVCFSHVVLGDYIIHTFNDEMHIESNAPSANMNFIFVVERLFICLTRVMNSVKANIC